MYMGTPSTKVLISAPERLEPIPPDENPATLTPSKGSNGIITGYGYSGCFAQGCSQILGIEAVHLLFPDHCGQ
jgi:hypothetical protein